MTKPKLASISASTWQPNENCFCGGPEETLYPHRYGTGRFCGSRARREAREATERREGEMTENELNLTTTVLRELADGLDELGKSRISVSGFDLMGHRVTVRRHDDQREGTSYVVTRIERLPGPR